MKKHILAALREEFDQWEKALVGLGETQILREFPPGELSVKDELAHLWAWQQRSIARMEAGLNNTDPKMPAWLPDVDPESEPNTDQINAYIYETHRDQAWAAVYAQWRTGFLRLLEVSEQLPEPTLLDASRYRWLGGYALANVLLGSYDHHQEHLDKLVARLGLLTK